MADEREPQRPLWRQFFESRSWLANGLVIAAIVLTFISGQVDSRGARIALFAIAGALILVSIGVFFHASRVRRQQAGD